MLPSSLSCDLRKIINFFDVNFESTVLLMGHHQNTFPIGLFFRQSVPAGLTSFSFAHVFRRRPIVDLVQTIIVTRPPVPIYVEQKLENDNIMVMKLLSNCLTLNNYNSMTI